MSRSLQSWVAPSSARLIRCEWIGTGDEGIWNLVFRVLHELSARQSVLDELCGRVSVFCQGRDPESWPLSVLPDGLVDLQARVHKANDERSAWMPTEVTLRARVDVVLPEDVSSVEVADWEMDEERVHAVRLPLERADDRADVPPGFRCWRVAPEVAGLEENSPIYLDFTCADDEQPPKLWLGVKSAHELWRPWSIYQEGPLPSGRHSLERLRRAIAQVAAATGGSVSLPAETQSELDRANGAQ